MKMYALDEEVLENVCGGNVNHYPTNPVFRDLGLGNIVSKNGGPMDKSTYNALIDGNWKEVSSDDMLAYVEQTVGSSDPRYQALKQFCERGYCYYNGGYCIAVTCGRK